MGRLSYEADYLPGFHTENRQLLWKPGCKWKSSWEKERFVRLGKREAYSWLLWETDIYTLLMHLNRVSNFSVKNLGILLKEARVTPAVNQVRHALLNTWREARR
jgi:hypothetical protein